MVDRLKGLPLGPGKKMASGGRFSKWAAYFASGLTRARREEQASLRNFLANRDDALIQIDVSNP